METTNLLKYATINSAEAMFHPEIDQPFKYIRLSNTFIDQNKIAQVNLSITGIFALTDSGEEIRIAEFNRPKRLDIHNSYRFRIKSRKQIKAGQYTGMRFLLAPGESSMKGLNRAKRSIPDRTRIDFDIDGGIAVGENELMRLKLEFVMEHGKETKRSRPVLRHLPTPVPDYGHYSYE